MPGALLTSHLRLDINGPVARLVLDRPARRNAMNLAMWEALPGLVDQAMADPAVRLLQVESAHAGMFCAGADIEEFVAASADPAWRARHQAAIRGTQLALARAPKPSVAIVDGDAAGGGCGIAMACDVRLASPRARFGVTPAKLGLVYPLHDTRLLTDLVGVAQARRLLFTAMMIDAAEAAQIGLVQVVADDLVAEAADFAAQIVAQSAHSQLASKAMVQRIIEGAYDDDAASAAVFDAALAGPAFAEGSAAFLQKRKPVFDR
ncbi:enoyl-CoA hydratase/isomerase family protein [Polymorphobacter fuscus]|uniref:enoyl-CoA hydratase/isomerase family protein n=1 Tax=Sandarakinorhabdus fusca TaxID=1439888 RepID=UPI0016ABC262|nr:enoyl-CoA hydratase-related protein [Polymorphobacter fuscus]NJC07718.1 enoyl-CoA hydratase/carnithine racemase [Polymorphobacter fuscus]